MLDTATAFFLAGERCAPELKFGAYGRHRVDAPCIVSYALATEIALKLLARNAGTRSNGHSLVQIYRELPDEVRASLVYVEDCIDEIDRYFVDWRYPYEADFLVGHTSKVRRAFILCYREIKQRMPDLSSIYERNWGSFEPDWDWAWPELELAQLDMTSS